MIRANHVRRWAVAWVLPLLGCAPMAFSQDDDFDRTPAGCLVVTTIDRTKVLDDQTILFYMRGKRAYRNVLPRRCPGLLREDRFAYQARGGRLCSTDTITVLEQFGSRFNAGFTCAIGEFHPVSEEEVEDLLATGKGNRRGAIKSEPVELEQKAGGVSPPEGGEAAAPAETVEDD